MKLYLLRHGETDWSKEGKLQGRTDIPLNENGVRQMEAVADYMIGMGELVDVIVTSPLQRAKKSAEIIAGKMGIDPMKIQTEPGFLERNFGMGEGLTLVEREARFQDRHYPNMESVEDLCKRARNAILKCVERFNGKTVLVTAHGSILKAVLTEMTDGEYATYSEGLSVLETGKMCLLIYEDGEFTVEYCNKEPVMAEA